MTVPFDGFVRLRSASAADAAAVADVYLASRRAFLPYAPIAHSEVEVRDWIAATLIPSGGVTVAIVQDELVGLLAVSVDAGGTGWVDQLYLSPGATGRGIGARLLDHALAALPRPVRLFTFAENTGARAFYERHGFSAIEFGDGAGNEEGCPDVLYELG
jgi:ribosomal protein S18 acetylase RimI-like enzyme